MKTALADAKLSCNCRQALIELGFDVLKLPPFSKLPKPVCSHPDMLLFRLESGEVVIGREYYLENKQFFDNLDVSLAVDDISPGGEYPNDIVFDALGVGDTLYGKEGFISRKLVRCYTRFVSVKQGYTRCSVAMLSDRCAVTSDIGIASALKKDGISVLEIRPGYILLEGYDTGFIGGAGARLENGLYCFFGDIMSHPDGDKIISFAKENKINAVSLSGEPLSDNGGLLVI